MAGEFLSKIPVIGPIFRGGKGSIQGQPRERLPVHVKGNMVGDVTGADASVQIYRDTSRVGDPLMELTRYGANATVNLPGVEIEGEISVDFTGLAQLDDPLGYEASGVKVQGLRFSGGAGASVGALPQLKKKK